MIHFSVDDTITIFENLTKGAYDSCFEEPTLCFLKKLHDTYGLKVTMYCFYEAQSGFCLGDATDKFQSEFKENSHWLRFGFHGYNERSRYADYDATVFTEESEKVYDSLERIVSCDSLSYDVRLGFATGNLECVKAFKNRYPLFQTLYGADDGRIEYYLLPEENRILLETGSFYEKKAGITVKLSEVRLEDQENMEQYLENLPPRDVYAFFTHEQWLGTEQVRQGLVALCTVFKEFTF